MKQLVLTAEKNKRDELLEFTNHSGVNLASIAEESCGKVKELCRRLQLLNAEQKEVFDCVSAHFCADPCTRTQENSQSQLRLLLSGAGGTGKSFLLETITLYARLFFKHNHTRYGPVLVLAPTGKAALNIGGRTIESVLLFSVAQNRRHHGSYELLSAR